jgi:hypothetical protein
MKTGRIAAAIGMIVGGTLAMRPAFAQTVAFPTAARGYTAWMARATDECSAPSLTVLSGGPGLPATGCLQANNTTDDETTMAYARLVINSRSGRILVFGSGFAPGQRVKVQLTARVTRSGVATKHPLGINNVTFQDVAVQCPNTPFGLTVRPNGVLLGSLTLSDCFMSPGLAKGNIEILDAALLNVDNGDKVFARPGLER